MSHQEPDKHDLKDKILTLFRPIEQLFKIMDTSSVEIYGELTRSYADVGITLCQNFRHQLDAILLIKSGGSSNDQR